MRIRRVRAAIKIMDPIGMALENFDAVGLWRTSDGGIPIDPRGKMYDGQSSMVPSAYVRPS